MQNVRRSLLAAAVFVALAVGTSTPSAWAESWYSAPQMPTPRYALGAAKSPVDGRIYVIGGVSNGVFLPTVLDDAAAYDLRTGTWRILAPMPTARGGLAVVVARDGVDGVIYAIGGEGFDGVPLTTVERYHPSASPPFWEPAPAALPQPRAALAATVANCLGSETDSCIYAIGGFDGSTVVNTVYAYTPGGWTTVPPLVTAREKLAVTSAPCPQFPGSTCMYAIGGFDGNAVVSTVEAYDLADPDGAWVAITGGRPLTARQYLAATTRRCPPPLDVTHACVYAIGGAGAQPNEYLDIVEVYDPLNPSAGWVQAAPIPAPRSALAAVTMADNTIYALGGASAGFFLPVPHDTVEVYGVDPDTWEASLPRAPHNDIAAALTGSDGRIYVVGSSRDSPMLVFDPNTAQWTRAAPMPGESDRPGWVASLGRVDGQLGFYFYRFGGVLGGRDLVDAYNPDTDTWTPVARMPTPRGDFGAAAVVLPDGSPRIYAIGGSDAGRLIPQVGIYDPIRDVWTLGANMPTPREALGVASAICRPPRSDHVCIYAIGGGIPGVGSENVVEEYDPTTDSWRTGLAPMPTRREGLRAVTGGDGRIHAVGGCSRDGILPTVEVYDPVSNSWSAGANMLTARCFPAATASRDGRAIYVLGGLTRGFGEAPAGGPGDLDTGEIYHPETRGWTTNVPSMSTPRAGHAAVTARCPTPSEGSCTYAIGGVSDLFSGTALDSVEAYSPGAQSWTVTASMPTARFNLAAAAGPCSASGEGQCIYAMGGRSGRNPSDVRTNVEVYDPSTDSWATAAPLPVARELFAAASGPCPATGEGQCIYVLGGFDPAIRILNTVDVYDPSTGTWTSVAPMFTRRRTLAAVTGPDGRIYAIGGRTDVAPFSLNTVEAFEPRTGTWSPVVSMNDAKPEAVAANGAGGRIYAMSGTNLEVYIPGAPGEARWVRLQPMTRGDVYAAARGPDGRIYRIGGYRSGVVLSTVEALQP